MRISTFQAAWIAVPFLLLGLVLGVAIGRSRTPFALASALDSVSGSPASADLATAIEADELKRLVDSGIPISLIDVREPDEYAAFHIAGSKLIPLGALWARQSEIPRDRAVVVYCTSDLRSQIAARELGRLGLTNVRRLKGGITAWQNAGLIVTK